MKNLELKALYVIMLAIIIFELSGFKSQAQDVQNEKFGLVQKESALFKFPKKERFLANRQDKNGDIIVFSEILNKQLSISRIVQGKTLRTTTRKTEDLGLGEFTWFQNYITNDEGEFLILITYNRKDKSHTIRSLKIDIEADSWGTAKTLFEIKGLASHGGYDSFEYTKYFKFYYNHDSSQLLLRFNYIPEFRLNSKNRQEVGYIFLGIKGEPKVEWMKDIKMPYTESRIEFNGLVLDKNNKIFEQIIVKSENSEEARNGISSSELIYIDQESGEAKLMGLGGDKKGYMYNTSLNLDGLGNAHVIGLFKTEREGKPEHVFLAYVDKEERVFNDFRYIDIPPSTYSQKSPDKKDPEASLFIRDIAYDKNGDIYVLTQVYDSWKVFQTAAAHEWLGNFSVIKIKNQSDDEWTKTIPCEFYFTTHYFRHRFYVSSPGQLILMTTLDDTKNSQSSNMRDWQNSSYSVNVFKINASGKIVRNKIKEDTNAFEFSSAFQKGNKLYDLNISKVVEFSLKTLEIE